MVLGFVWMKTEKSRKKKKEFSFFVSFGVGLTVVWVLADFF